MKINKIAPIVVGIALIAGLTTGCTAGGSSPDAGQKTTVNWWTWDPNQEAAYQKCVPAFEKANPDITVKMSQYNVSDYFTKLTAGFVAGNAPDAFMNSVTYLQSYASQNQLLPLDKYIKQDKLDLASTYSIGSTAWKYTDGKQYALPMDWATETLYYNKDALAKAGYSAADIDHLNWNPTDGGTFQKMVEHLTIDKNGVRGDQPGFDANNVKTYGIGNLESTGDPFGQNTWGVLLATDNINIPNKQSWATELRYGDPQVVQGLQNVKNLSTKGYAPQFNQFTSADTDQLASGQVAMTIGGTWEASTFAKLPNFKAGVAPVPMGSDGKRHVWSNSNGNVISASSKHPDQTWKWISYQESAACQTKAALVNGSFLPSIASSMAALAKSQESQGVDFSVFTNYVNNNELIPSPVYNNGAAIQNAVVPQFEAYFTGKSDASIFPKMQAQAKTLLAAK